MRTLHITNGDGAANLLKSSSVSGDVLPWRDPMHHGPFPADLSLDELSGLRARYLVGPTGDPTEAERDFRLRDDHLRAATNYDSIVLWFEHDLLDQLQILQILDWFAGTDLGETSLEMICIDWFPGIEPFRGLGELTPDQIRRLYPARNSVPVETLRLARAGWQAFRSDDPNHLLDFTKVDLSPLPYLAAALWRHFEEFPFMTSGLTRTEAQLLSLVAKGIDRPSQLFVKNMDLEIALFIGDWRTFTVFDTLCASSLLANSEGAFQYPPFKADRTAFENQRLQLTDVGRSVLEGQETAFRHVRRDGWLGGVRVASDDNMWTWNGQSACFERHDS
ncbi:MAG: hypothetical protein AAF729_03630 [Pseudomonadota bacterium]